MTKTKALLTLMRPANIITAVADVLAGVALSGYFAGRYADANALVPVLLLALSTMGLYGGGVVFNDVFDVKIDRLERPERPLPSGRVALGDAVTLGVLLLALGIFAAIGVGKPSFLLAVGVAVCALVYDKWGKHFSIAGPVNMGLCRGLNLLLGISLVPAALAQWWWLGLVPVVYIAAITTISRGEVFGGRKHALYLAVVLYAVVIGAIAGFGLAHTNLPFTLLFLAGFAWMIFPPLAKALAAPAGPNIGKAVKAGVIGLIFMNAAWAAAAGWLMVAIVIVALLPVSLKLAKIFAVT